MKKRLVLVVMTLCLLAELLLATPANAQEPTIADSPVQSPTWYSFRVGRVEDDFDSKVTVSSNDRSTSFQLFTADEVDFWARPEEGDWFGQASCGGSVDDDEQGTRGVQWCGNLVPGTYYVHRNGGDAQIGVSGRGVTALTPIIRGEAANEMQESESSGIVFAEEHILVQGEESEPATCGTWIENHEDCAKLLTFRVGRVEDELPTVTVTLHTAPTDGVGHFQVFTAGNAPCAWEYPEEGDWIGISNETDADDEYYINNNRWSGKLVAGSYVVRVEPEGADSFMLAVSGEAVAY